MLTDVELLFAPGREERWLRFGRPSAERQIDGRRRIVSFAPGDIFGLVRWRGNDFGTVESRLDIVRAVAPGEALTSAPCVAPGGELLLGLRGWPRVERALKAIDSVEALGLRPEEAAPAYWRHVAKRVEAGGKPRAYDAARHRAWRARLELQ